MLTKSELFWQLFRSSGHVGAYLLYTDFRGNADERGVSTVEKALSDSTQMNGSSERSSIASPVEE